MQDRIIEILKEIRPEFDFVSSVNFIDDGYLDSFDIIQLVDALDQEFHISIDGLDIVPKNFMSVDNIVTLIAKK